MYRLDVRRSSYALAAACVLGCSLARAQGGASVDPPDGWYAGDTHEHLQQCYGVPNKSLADVLDRMEAENLNVSSVLVWGALQPELYESVWLPLVTGVEASETSFLPADVDRVIQIGAEMSGFQASDFGHAMGLGIGPAQADFLNLSLCDPACAALLCKPGDVTMEPSYPGRVFDLFRTDLTAATGYGHQVWPIELAFEPPPTSQPIIDTWTSLRGPGPEYVCWHAGESPAFPVISWTSQPLMAPVDVALGRVDFLEALDMEAYDHILFQPGRERWYGLWYKLLSAGLHVAPAGGSDANCGPQAASPRTWAQLAPGATLTYDEWLRALRRGRVTISAGSQEFLDVTVEGQGVGRNVYVEPEPSGLASVKVRATLSVADVVESYDTVVEILVNGEVVATSTPLDFSTGPKTRTFIETVHLSESAWICARTSHVPFGAQFGDGTELRPGRTHTAAVYTYVAGKPVSSCRNAEYLALYCDSFEGLLDSFLNPRDPSDTFALEVVFGCETDAMRAETQHAKRHFLELRDAGRPLPEWGARRRRSSPACRGPLAIGYEGAPSADSSFTLTCVHAPPSAIGTLVIGTQLLDGPIVFQGADVWVSGPGGDYLIQTAAQADGGGLSEVDIHVPALPPGGAPTLYAQFLFPTSPFCPGNEGAGYCASDVLEFQPF